MCRREVHGPGAGCTAGPAGTLGPLHGFRAAARHPPVADPTARAFEAPRPPLRCKERIVYSLRFVRFKQMQGIGQLVYESKFNVLVMNLCDKEKLKKELLLSSKLY